MNLSGYYTKNSRSVISSIGLAAGLLVAIFILSACKRDQPGPGPEEPVTLTIFSVNDVHAQIDNFAKIKYIVDEARSEGEVFLVSCGDLFSGNPVVDFVEPKGFPVIELMNSCGFDVAVLGNHEFDYGELTLSERMAQADFDFVLANADMSASVIPEPDEWITLDAGDLKISFLGLVQTSRTNGIYIPATHPFRVENITFTPASDIIGNYDNLKEVTGSDLVVLLSHLGTGADFSMAAGYPYMDLIIGGHSHAVIDTTINNIPIYQCGSYLRYLGKITLKVLDGGIVDEEFELINLSAYPFIDSDLAGVIDGYNDVPELDEVIGYSETWLGRSSGLGCFYTDILMKALDADLSIQNSGGLRTDLDQGDISVREIYSIDPFNNGARVYSMTVEQIERFLDETGAGFHYSGVLIETDTYGGSNLSWPDGTEIPNTTTLKLGVNDYIPAVYGSYFSNPQITGKTTAEEIIEYLRNNPGQVNYSSCSGYYSN